MSQSINKKTSDLVPLLITDQMAADLLCLSRCKVWHLVKSGDLHPVRIGKRSTRFALAEVKDLASKREAA